MKVILIRFNSDEWVLVPARNSKEDIVNLYTKLNINEFKNLLEGNIVKDIENQPDKEHLLGILNKQNYNGLEVELYEII